MASLVAGPDIAAAPTATEGAVAATESDQTSEITDALEAKKAKEAKEESQGKQETEKSSNAAEAAAGVVDGEGASLRRFHVGGWFTGTGGCVGVSVRVELKFSESANGSPVHVFVWSDLTNSWDVPGCSFEIEEDGRLNFGPELMNGMKGTVVNSISALLVPETDEVFLQIGIKLSRFVPSFTIEAHCVGVLEPIRAVKKSLEVVRRKLIQDSKN